MFTVRSEEIRRGDFSYKLEKSEEIECQVGHYLEVIHRKRLPRQRSWHPDASSCDIQFTSEVVKTIHHAKSVDQDNELHDVSFIMRSELLRVHGTSWQAAVLIMANCTVGMGLLNFPHAVLRAGGILPALITQSVTLLFIIVSLTMMCKLAQYYGDVSFQGLVGSHLGHIPKVICKVLIFINNFATLVVFLVVIGDQLEHIMKTIQSDSLIFRWFSSRKIMVPILSTLLIFPFCLFKRFDIFKYTSFLGVVAALYVAFGLIMTRYFLQGPIPSHTIVKRTSPHLLQIIPLICFAYECHIEIPPMVACLKVQNFWYFEKMIFGYAILSCVVYSVSGIFGFLTFGSSTPDDIVLAYAPNDTLVIIALVLLSLKIMTTYPVVFYCLRIVGEDLIRSHWRVRQSLHNHDWVIRLCVSIALFASSVILAIFVPSITSVINFIGGVSAIFIFIFPGMCYFRMYSSETEVWKWRYILLGALYITLGVFLAGVTTTQAIEEYITR